MAAVLFGELLQRASIRAGCVQDTIKVKLQTAAPGQAGGALDAARSILRAQGPLGLYKASPAVCQLATSQAPCFMHYFAGGR